MLQSSGLHAPTRAVFFLFFFINLWAIFVLFGPPSLLLSMCYSCLNCMHNVVLCLKLRSSAFEDFSLLSWPLQKHYLMTMAAKCAACVVCVAEEPAWIHTCYRLTNVIIELCLSCCRMRHKHLVIHFGSRIYGCKMQVFSSCEWKSVW